MALQKTAVALPRGLLRSIDVAARRRHESRNAFITRVLEAAVRAKRNRDITARLDALFLDPGLREEDRRAAHELSSASTHWADEGW